MTMQRRLAHQLIADAARASSRIEVVIVSEKDALAALEGREMLAEPAVAAEHLGTQRSMSWVLTLTDYIELDRTTSPQLI
jgi:hypothetical protein